MRYRSSKDFIFFILMFTFVFCGMRLLALRASEDLYGGILVPTADPAWQTTMSGYLLAYPAGGAGQISIPISERMTASLYGGISGYPSGFFGSAYLRAHIVRPDISRWGLAAQTQSGVAVALSGGEGSGGIVNGIAIVASSPLKYTRVNFGAALHTMPGSEYKPGWEDAKDYDFRNPQPTFFISGGHTFSTG